MTVGPFLALSWFFFGLSCDTIHPNQLPSFSNESRYILSIFQLLGLLVTLPTLLPIETAEVGNYHYGPQHPMKPHRIRMTHNLIINYGLWKKLSIFVGRFEWVH